MFSYISSFFYSKPLENAIIDTDLDVKNKHIIEETNDILQKPRLFEHNKKNGFFTETIETKIRNSDGQLVQDYCEIYEGEWYNDMKHGKGKLEITSIDECNNKKIIYDGQFIANNKHGYGILKVDDQEPIKGVWFDDKLLEIGKKRELRN